MHIVAVHLRSQPASIHVTYFSVELLLPRAEGLEFAFHFVYLNCQPLYAAL